MFMQDARCQWLMARHQSEGIALTSQKEFRETVEKDVIFQSKCVEALLSMIACARLNSQRFALLFPFIPSDARGDGAPGGAFIFFTPCGVASLKKDARHPTLHRGISSNPGHAFRESFRSTRSASSWQGDPCISRVEPRNAPGWVYETHPEDAAPCSAEMTSHDNALG